MSDGQILVLRRCADCGVWFFGPFLVDRRRRPVHVACWARLYPERIAREAAR